jgi:hypothetical protein
MRRDGNEERGVLVLARLRGRERGDQVVQREKEDILRAIAIESKEEGTWGDLFRDNGIGANKRFYLALGIQFMQQMSGKYSVSCTARHMLMVFQVSILSHTMHQLCSKTAWG